MKKYPAAKLLFTDTDSLYYKVETPNIEKEMFENKELFDYSDYPANSPYFDATNKKVMGKFKSETKGAAILEFVGLRPKMYSYKYKESSAPDSREKERQRAKGIQREAIRDLTHARYKAQLELPAENRITSNRLGSKLHKIYAISVLI